VTRRVLKRPRHGWAQTAAERLDRAATSGLLQAICLCWLATITVSVFGATVTLLQNILIGF
jgi:hypothetical protein